MKQIAAPARHPFVMRRFSPLIIAIAALAAAAPAAEESLTLRLDYGGESLARLLVRRGEVTLVGTGLLDDPASVRIGFSLSARHPTVRPAKLQPGAGPAWLMAGPAATAGGASEIGRILSTSVDPSARLAATGLVLDTSIDPVARWGVSIGSPLSRVAVWEHAAVRTVGWTVSPLAPFPLERAFAESFVSWSTPVPGERTPTEEPWFVSTPVAQPVVHLLARGGLAGRELLTRGRQRAGWLAWTVGFSRPAFAPAGAAVTAAGQIGRLVGPTDVRLSGAVGAATPDFLDRAARRTSDGAVARLQTEVRRGAASITLDSLVRARWLAAAQGTGTWSLHGLEPAAYAQKVEVAWTGRASSTAEGSAAPALATSATGPVGHRLVLHLDGLPLEPAGVQLDRARLEWTARADGRVGPVTVTARPRSGLVAASGGQPLSLDRWDAAVGLDLAPAGQSGSRSVALVLEPELAWIAPGGTTADKGRAEADLKAEARYADRDRGLAAAVRIGVGHRPATDAPWSFTAQLSFSVESK